MAYADIDDVALYYEGLTEPSGELEDKVERLLEQAEAAIRQEVTDLDAHVTAGRVQEILLVQVESEMVSAVLKNPNSYLSESASVSGVSESHTLDLKSASGLLRFTADHRRLLGLPARGRGGRAFTVPAARVRHRVLDAETG